MLDIEELEKIKNEELEKLFCAAISEKHLVRFSYKSDNESHSTPRIVEPYLVVVYNTGKIQMVGFPVSNVPQTDQLGHYLFEKIVTDEVEILAEKFDRIKVPFKAVFDTPTVSVKCSAAFE